MRIVIFCDMEGVACIENWEQVTAGRPLYEEARKLYTDEMNAAVRGARAAGATEIIVVDCHGAGGAYNFKSFLPERLESGAQYVLGHPWARYIEAFERGCDAILFVGAHAMAGTPDGVLCHTVSSETWYNAWINETRVGESGILAAIAGCWDVPAVFVSGDAATCREVTALLGPQVVTAEVKRGLSCFSAVHMAPRDACSLIEMGVARALSTRNWPKPYKPATSPVTFKVELSGVERASDFKGRQGVEIVGPRTVVSTATTFWQAWDQFWYRHA
ncbi:MAG: M55 family metallopeptidase [Thermogemmatispora sp.]|uniref:M55 family metallopeptidase n=1 Tax=Thermogemmatispora sp. TaxID=1968838 RepID=UPI002627323E|nr:M55 family metallopeptidase [Thermogemmatispora sp.]MBX5456601.1 M55 family metallopeptidase [Thermogemmatispora sp.]